MSLLPGLTPKKAAGAMYIMVGIDFSKFKGIKNDLDFVQMLIKEQSVFCLPASVNLRLCLTFNNNKNYLIKILKLDFWKTKLSPNCGHNDKRKNNRSMW